jgi:hypothetical protein
MMMKYIKFNGAAILLSKIAILFLSFILLASSAESHAGEALQSPNSSNTPVQDHQNQTEINTYQSLLAPEEELIYLLFGSINNHQNQEAVKLLSQNLNPSKETERHWLEQFNAIRSVHILDLKEIPKDTWTETKKFPRVKNFH